MTGARVSVIVPVYNVEEFLSDCLQSIQNQNYLDIEVLVVDDGSRDGSREIALGFARRDPRFSLLTQPNSGVSAARNLGINNSTGEWITFVDADDWLAPDFIEELLGTAHEFEADVVVSTSVLRAPIPVHVPAKRWAWEAERATEALLYPEIPIGCWNKLYNRQFLERNSLRFQTKFHMGEGLNFITDATQRSSTTAFTNAATYYYRRDNSGSVTSRLDLTRMQNAIDAIDNIETNLTVTSSRLRLALEYQRWRTNFLCLVIQIDAGLKSESKRTLRTLRRDSLRMTFRTRLSNPERVKTAAIAVAPTTMARLMLSRKRRRQSP